MAAGGGAEPLWQRLLGVVGSQIDAIDPSVDPKTEEEAPHAPDASAAPAVAPIPFDYGAPFDGPLREVTLEELRQRGMINRRGPRPNASLIELANTIARSRLRGMKHSVRDLAGSRHASGCKRQRATRYAEVIASILLSERAPQAAAAGVPSSALTSAPTPALLLAYPPGAPTSAPTPALSLACPPGAPTSAPACPPAASSGAHAGSSGSEPPWREGITTLPSSDGGSSSNEPKSGASHEPAVGIDVSRIRTLVEDAGKGLEDTIAVLEAAPSQWPHDLSEKERRERTHSIACIMHELLAFRSEYHVVEAMPDHWAASKLAALACWQNKMLLSQHFRCACAIERQHRLLERPAE